MIQESYILLIAPPGHLRASLQVLLAALPGGHSIVVASGEQMETLGTLNRDPALVLIALEPSSSGTQVDAVVAEIKHRWLQARLVVLVDTEQQRQAVASAGANRVWFKGTLAAQMLVEIEALLNHKD